MTSIELITYTTNHNVEADLNHNTEVTTAFCGDKTAHQSQDLVDGTVELCLRAEENFDNDLLSLDSFTVAVDWEPEDRAFHTYDKIYSSSNMQETNYGKGYGMTLNNRSRSEASFTSYIDLETKNGKDDESVDVNPDLLEGELLISKADRVCSYSTVSGLTSGLIGTLFVTTLKLSLKLHTTDEQKSRRNKILSSWDIPLSSIYTISEITGEGTQEKKKKIPFDSNVNNKIDGIFVVCKNFRFYRFSFKFAKIDQGRNVVNALLHHVRPKKNNLLFAFEQSLYKSLGEGSEKVSSWKSILKSAQTKNVRVTKINESWRVCTSLPQQFIVPGHVTDGDLTTLARIFTGDRPPVWVWGTPEGGALYIQPTLNVLPSPQINQMKRNFYGNVSSDKFREVDLDKLFTGQSGLEDSLTQMLELHCVENEKEAEKMDSDYFSRLENSGWLSTLSTALRLSSEICDHLWEGRTVVLLEGEGRGSSLLVASLVELLLEPDWRTRKGLETLIQHNWVSLGFPFSTNHQLCSIRTERSIVPLFLMFLDCVHQLTLQFPAQFEFLPSYLIDVWDTALLPMFDTFIFDCEHDRGMARRNPETPLSPSSAWNWELQFSKQYIQEWNNPLFGIPRRPQRSHSASQPSQYAMQWEREIIPPVPENCKFLPVNYRVCALSVWTQLFHRSVSFFQRSNESQSLLLSKQREAKSVVDTIYNTTSATSKST